MRCVGKKICRQLWFNNNNNNIVRITMCSKCEYADLIQFFPELSKSHDCYTNFYRQAKKLSMSSAKVLVCDIPTPLLRHAPDSNWDKIFIGNNISNMLLISATTSTFLCHCFFLRKSLLPFYVEFTVYMICYVLLIHSFFHDGFIISIIVVATSHLLIHSFLGDYWDFFIPIRNKN